jgi:fumarate reductase subunit C
MSRPAHPHAMQPPHPGRTRTAPPQLPDQFPSQGRYLPYMLFGATGLLYGIAAFVILRAVWALGSGPDAWQAARAGYASPLSIAFHALAFAGVCFVAVRFFGLFPKAQPPRIGPAKPPPRPVIQAMLYAAWIGVSVVLATILAGGLF